MTTNPLPSWRPQSPSPDFAARAVAAILRDRSLLREKRRVHRWVPIVAAASMLLAGAAFAWTALPRTPKVPVNVPARSEATTSEKHEVHAVPPALEPVPELPRKPPAPPAMAPLRRKETPAAAAPDAGRRVIVPLCNCQEVICDCLEQH